MEITYQLTADDCRSGYVAWQTRSSPRRLSYCLNFVLFPLLLLGGAWMLTWKPPAEPHYLPWIVMGIALMWTLAVLVAPRFQAKMQFRRMPSAHTPTTMTISHSGMHIRSQHYDSQVAWSTYIGWSEANSVFVLFPQPRIYVPVPKRAFTEEQLAEFREILRRNVSKK